MCLVKNDLTHFWIFCKRKNKHLGENTVYYRAMPYRGRSLTICAPLQLSRLWHSKEDQVVLEYQVEI